MHSSRGGVYIVADRVRSYPLFYGYDARGTYVSDDPYWIQDRMGDHSLDEVAKREFSLTGFVTNDGTLSPAIKQVRSGEIVHLSGDGRRSDRAFYQRFNIRSALEDDLEARLNELDRIMLSVFRRLIHHAQGRTLVIPLSGGYDSRLIALMLRRLGYDNVLAFTYGRVGSEEAKVSQSVAEALGIEWRFVEYSNDKWFQWYNSPEYRSYARWASSLASTPHCQDFPAVWMMKRDGLLPDDAIFLPGHSATLYNTPEIEGDLHYMERAYEDIIERHYNLNGQPITDPALLHETRNNIAAALGDLNDYDNRSDACVSWDFNNRQSKYIINSVRVYEFWGYDWWLPLEDRELMDYWCRLPFELITDKRLLKEYVGRMESVLTGSAIGPTYERTGPSPQSAGIIGSVLKNKVISKMLSYPYYYHRKITQYWNHPLAYFGIVPWDQYRKEWTGREVIIYYQAMDELKKLHVSI